jgi:hypothetical protein
MIYLKYTGAKTQTKRFPIMKEKILLNVTGRHPIFGTPWTGYIVENHKAYPLAGGATIDAMRDYASREEFDGILIGSPSVEWAT